MLLTFMPRSGTPRVAARTHPTVGLIVLFSGVFAYSLSQIASTTFGNETTKQRPNVIVILADDFGYECVGANGGTSYKTPYLDQLATSGMRFEHGYAQPLCTPTRVQLMTGKYNVRNYVEFGLLDKKETTFAQLMKSSGYATCIVGKWQLGHDFTLPAHFGFDEYCLWQLTRRPGRYKNPGLEINGKEIDYNQGEYGPDLVNDYALDFVSRKKDKPFLLYYPMMLTHDPYDATPDSVDWNADVTKGTPNKKKANQEEGNPKHQHFADMVTYMDKLIGKLTQRLDELKIRDNTLILFIGDNGTGAGTPSQFKGRKVIGGKGSVTDAGMRVPLIANWPAAISGKQICHDLVDTTDFLPTICHAAGVPIPGDLLLDGRSFLPQLKGEKGVPREWIYCWYARGGGYEAQHEFARNQRYKLLRNGSFFEVLTDQFEERKIDQEKMPSEAAAARKILQAALDQYADARPKRFHKENKKDGDKKTAKKKA